MRNLTARLGAADRAWLDRITGRDAPRWLDRTLRTVTHAGGATATVAGPAVLLLAPTSRRLGTIMLAANAASHLLVQLLKRTVVRPRPGAGDPDFLVRAAHPDAYSFPSGHACAAMALAASAVLDGHLLAGALVAAALVVGASRVYLRVHYPTDVLVGQAIGALAAVAAWHALA